MADSLAASGADYLQRSLWWRRPFSLTSWGADAFIANCAGNSTSIHPGTHCTPQYSTSRSSAPTTIDLEETDTAVGRGHEWLKDIPSMHQFTQSISEVGRLCGKARPRFGALPTDLKEFRMQIKFRRQHRNAETDQIARHRMSLEICKMQRHFDRLSAQRQLDQATEQLCLSAPYRKTAQTNSCVQSILDDQGRPLTTLEEIIPHVQ